MKKVVSFAMCLIVMVSGFSCLNVLADAYGTEADGISGNVLNVTPSESFNNGDFSDGFKYWGSYFNNHTGASNQASLVNDGENVYMEIDRDMPDSDSVKGVRSAPFKIKNLSAGDEIYLFIDYKVSMYDSNKSGQMPLIAAVKSNSSDTVLASDIKIGSPAKTNVTKWTNGSASASVSSVTGTDEDIFYVQVYINYGPACKLSIDNIKVAVKRNSGDNITPEGYCELTDGKLITLSDLNYYGTETDGTNKTISSFEPIDSFKNADFSEGLKYWGNDGSYASDNASIEIDGDNKYLVIDRETVQNSPKGIYSIPFKVSGIKAGDVLAIALDYKAELYPESTSKPYFYFTLQQKQATQITFLNDNDLRVSSSSTEVSNENIGTLEGWKSVAWRQIIDTAPEDDEAVFVAWIYMQYNVACKLSIDNIKVLIKHNSEENYTQDGFYELTDGTRINDNIFKGFTAKNGKTTESEIASGANDTNYPGLTYSWIGTKEDGIYTDINDIGASFPARTDFMNSDFESGLMYWIESQNTGYTSDVFSVETELNGNHYLNYSPADSNAQLNQNGFRLPKAKTGQKLYIMYRFRGDGAISVDGYVRNATDGTYPLTKASGLTGVLYYPESKDDWGYGVSKNYITVPDKSQITASNFGDEFCYYMMMKFSNSISIDSIMFVTLENQVYRDLDGNVIDIPENYNTLHTDSCDAFDWSVVYGTNLENTEFFNYGAYNKNDVKLVISASPIQGDVTVKANLKNNGTFVFENDILNGELSNIEFALPEKFADIVNKRVIFEYSIEASYPNASCSVALKSGSASRYQTFKSVQNGFTTGSLLLDDIGLEDFAELSFYSSNNAQCNIRNVAFGYDDIGGIEGLYAKADGSPYLYDIGDANADNMVDIRDMVCMKKHIVDPDNKIYFAAANVDNSDKLISASDLAMLRKGLLGIYSKE